MAYTNKSERFDFWGNPSCAICGSVIHQSGGRGRVKVYCSNRCKMKARSMRGYIDRYHFGNLLVRRRGKVTRRLDTKKAR